MFPQSGGSGGWSTFIPILVIIGVLVLRNSRARRLRIETLWITPLIYVVLLAPTLFYAPPPMTPISISLLVGGAVLGGLIGWQRGRFTRIDIHPETHDITARQSALGIIFIVGILAVRLGARDLLAANAASLHLPVIAGLDAFFVLAIVMLAVQRLEIWTRATRMLAEAKGTAAPLSAASPVASPGKPPSNHIDGQPPLVS